MTTSRRDFIKGAAIIAGSMAFAPNLLAQSSIFNHRLKQKTKLGIALVGLGYYSTDLLAPALQETKHCYLAGIVTGTPEKAQRWKARYNIPDANIYNYDNYDEIAGNPEIDIIYVVLPNSMHAEYTIRAAKTGKHVICEKPMALTVEECKAMIDACRENNVTLSVGYRLHFEPTTQEIMKWGRNKEYGNINYVHASAGFKFKLSPDHWKVKRAYGGGPLMDMGVYSIQAARYSTQEEPVSVTAQQFQPDREPLKEVPETVTFQFEFLSGAVADLMTSFGTSTNLLYVACDDGWFELNPFSGYGGIKGNSNKGPIQFPQVNQQAKQMDETAWCIMNNKPMRVPGEEGLADIKIVMAIEEALKTGKKVLI